MRDAISEDKVIISLAVDRTKILNILSKFKSGFYDADQASQQINDLYEFTARQFQIKLNVEANQLLAENIDLTKKAKEEQHRDLTDIAKALRHDWK